MLTYKENNQYSNMLACIFLIIGAMLHLWSSLDSINISYFSHDDIRYIDTYFAKLTTEGRWINNLIFPFMQQMPGQPLVVVGTVSLAAFFYVVFRRLGISPIWSACLCLWPVQFAGFHDLLTWPTTIAPSCVVLVAAAIASRFLPMPFVMIAFGIALMGTYQGLFYLLPLLYLADAKDLRSTATVLALWITAFVIGFGISIIPNYYLTGRFGLSEVGWRLTKPITSIDALVQNILSRLSFIIRDWGLFFPNLLSLLGSAALLVIGLTIIILRPQLRWPTAILVAVYFSHYGISTLNGVHIQARTIGHSFSALVALSALIFRAQRFGALALVAIAPAVLSQWYISNNNLRWYREVTGIITSDISHEIDVAGEDVLMDFRDAENYWASVTNRLTTRPIPGYFEGRYGGQRVIPALVELGASSGEACPNYHGQNLSPKCLDAVPPDLEWCPGNVCSGRFDEFILIKFGERT